MASALKAARRTDTGPVKKADGRIIVACDCPDLNDPGSVLFSKDQVIEAIEGFAEGDRLEKQADSLKKLHEPTVKQFGVSHFAKRWAGQGGRPDNPTLTTKDDGSGVIVSMQVKDQAIKLNDTEFAALANLIGAKEAEEHTVKRDEIYFNQDKLAEEVNGKTVLEIIDEAVSGAFEKLKREDVLEGLFEIKEKFTTAKGLIDKGMVLVGGPGPDAARKLAEFIAASKAPVALRAGAGGK